MELEYAQGDNELPQNNLPVLTTFSREMELTLESSRQAL
jgi:hypothetical protein